MAVIVLQTGQKYAGVGRRSTTARTRAAIAMIRDGHNPRLSTSMIVDEYRHVSRHEAHGIVVDEYA